MVAPLAALRTKVRRTLASRNGRADSQRRQAGATANAHDAPSEDHGWADGTVTAITADMVEQLIQDGRPLVIELWAPWCAPCRVLAPILEQLALRHAGIVRFVKVNVDDEPSMGPRFAAYGVPTLLFLRAGHVVERAMGIEPLERLVERLESIRR